MDEILQKAKKGGYKYVKALPGDRRPSGKFAKMVMEKEFWQALGQECGWVYSGEDCFWDDFALNFHEINLLHGWDRAVKYLENLVK